MCLFGPASELIAQDTYCNWDSPCHLLPFKATMCRKFATLVPLSCCIIKTLWQTAVHAPTHKFSATDFHFIYFVYIFTPLFELAYIILVLQYFHGS